ncbi:hypothetical protein KO561_04350 [Radiobacillus kanasensis]|uniref:hypothetical protein n=1 Tax=Radiobacillus kanasensis TaxID=2844358 RepID=UPI001E488EE1|nr:hypothetical protein [Radiobacillus kanasensis]UFU00188.1 hypothetical protein KO561_04350 [Radiobacillus kanasensis]
MNTETDKKIILSYINNLQPPHINRHNVIALLLIGLDLMGFLPILSQPFSSTFFWLAIIPIILAHVWGLMYIIAPYKYEKSYYLFFGLLAIINTYVHTIVIQKLLYIHIGVQGPVYFISGILLAVGLLIFFQVFNIKMLYSGRYLEYQQKPATINTVPIILASSGGYVIAQILMSLQGINYLTEFITIVCLSLFTAIVAFFSVFIHKYMFIRKHFEIVKELNPSFGLPKKQRNDMAMSSNNKLEERYYVVILTVDEMTDEEHGLLADQLIDETGNVDVVSEVPFKEEYKQVLEQKFPDKQVTLPSFVVKPIEADRIDEETKKMEKEHKWRRFFNATPVEEYILAEARIVNDYRTALYYSDNVEDIIHYLQQLKCAM